MNSREMVIKGEKEEGEGEGEREREGEEGGGGEEGRNKISETNKKIYRKPILILFLNI